MPEGDTIYKVAARLRPRLVDRELVDVDCRYPAVVHGLIGRSVRSITTHGKQMLLHIDDDRTVLRVHLRMKGTWHRYAPGERWQRPPEAMGLRLQTSDDVLVCFWPELERIDARALRTHAVLSRLGPDLLDAPVPFEAIVASIPESRYADRLVGDVLLDQRVAAGIGNVYKSETLFAEQISPHTPATEVSPDQFEALYRRAAGWLKDNVHRQARITTGRTRPRLWVYGGRHGCLRCRTQLRHAELGVHRRITWWCPRCQPE